MLWRNASRHHNLGLTAPPFIIPSVCPTPECGIWGPICQTGTIVVAVNLTTTTTTTTMSCSAHLEAQSISVLDYYSCRVSLPSDYSRRFPRSPQCMSYIPEVKANYKVYMDNWFGGDLPTCANYTNSQLELLPIGITIPGVYNYYCCGWCALLADQFRLFYFPDNHSNNCSQTTSSLSTVLLSQQAHSLLGNGFTTVVVSGYTLYVTYSLSQST